MSQFFQSQVSLNYDFEATPETVRAQANSESDGVRDDIGTLRTEAEKLAADAKTIIEAVADFDPRTVPDVTFEANLGRFQLASNSIGAAPSGLYMAPNLGSANLGEAPTVAFDEFKRSTFTRPTVSGLDFPTAPSTGSISAPRRPADQTVSVPDAPPGGIELPDLQSVGSAPAFSGSFREIRFKNIEALSVEDVPMPDLSEFDRLQSAVDSEFVRNPYTQKMLPQTLTAATALLNGNFVLDMDALDQGVVQNLRTAINQHNSRSSRMWSRRGLRGNPAIAEYNDRVQARYLSDQRKSFDAAVHRWRMRLLPTVLQLNVEAHSLTTEILGELYDLDFAILEAKHTALRSLYALAAARYNAAVAEIEIRAARYRGVVEQARGLADVYRSKAQQQRAVGRLNAARGDGYEATQSARESEGDSFIAAVQMAEAVASAYETEMQGLDAKAQATRAELLNYQASLSSWEATLNQSQQAHRENRARNRAVVARNRGLAAQMSAQASEQEGVAFDARASAIDTTANVAQMRAEIESRGAKYVENSLQNSIEALEYAADVNRYAADTSKFETELLGDSQYWRSQNQVNGAVSGLYQQISQNATRAAELTQQYRVQLANAYQGLYETVGRAEASRVSGELSRYTASMGLQTTGSIDYSSNAFLDTTASTDVTNDQSNRSDTRYEPASF